MNTTMNSARRAFSEATFLDKIHWRIHKFFDSCARGDEGNIDLGKLNFTEMQNQIEQRDWITKIPSWIKKLTKRKESKDKAPYPQTTGESGQKRRQFTQSEERKTKILNPQVINGARLHDSEQLRMIFHPLNVKGITRPSFKNGNRICNRFHSVGTCFSDCRNIEGHVELDKDEAANYVKYVQAARAARTAFQQKRITSGDSTKSTQISSQAQVKEPTGSKGGA